MRTQAAIDGSRWLGPIWRVALVLSLTATSAVAAPSHPWMNPGLSPDKRADLVIAQMTLDEKIGLLHGSYGFKPRHRPEAAVPPAEARGGGGYIPSIPR